MTDLSNTTAPPRSGGILRGIRNLIAFLLGLAGMATIIASFTAFPSIGNLWRKYQHIRQQGDDYTLLYIGSSRVYHEFIPKQFDAALAERGHTIRSFNFGQDGMWPPESFYMLRELLKERSPKLKWVFIDLLGVKARANAEAPTKRDVYWHDFRHTLIALRHAMEVDMAGQRSFSEKATLCWQHTMLWAQKSTSLGRGQEQLEVALKLARERKLEKVKDEGFLAGGNGPLTGAMLSEFTEAVTRLRTNPPAKPIDPLFRDALDAITRDVRNAGAEPVFIAPSVIYAAERFTDWPPAGIQVLRFDDPNQFPDLYDPANRYDPHHLDPIGARNYTRHLANAFAQLLEKKP